ncbi:hypothetical protein IGI04_006560 [Brassica rapa subsp. trilocularis]|uniref:Transmembrane protein n=1 Tax=Brassica rapa subsp. trilocularis TaxID=1813537 RepID=A0ABQ7NJD6_BRACM|nr:hypothetical protein IGI04_006560 [Brassica rapa subsp. trilocularis]
MSSRPATANFTGSLFSAGIAFSFLRENPSQPPRPSFSDLPQPPRWFGFRHRRGRLFLLFLLCVMCFRCSARARKFFSLIVVVRPDLRSVLRVFGRGLWLFPYLVLCSSAVSSLWWSLSTVAIFCVVLLRAPTKQRLAFGVEIVTMAIQRSAFRSAFIGRVMCCPTRRIQRSLMKINKSLSYWIVKP